MSLEDKVWKFYLRFWLTTQQVCEFTPYAIGAATVLFVIGCLLVAVTMLVGGTTKAILDYSWEIRTIGWPEFWVGMGVYSTLIVLAGVCYLLILLPVFVARSIDNNPRKSSTKSWDGEI